MALRIRPARETDREFIFGLSPRLAEVARLPWHDEATIRRMQDDYIAQMLAQDGVPRTTLIVEKDGTPLGFIHACAHRDSISGEPCGSVPLLAVSPAAQGLGVGKLLIEAVERWAKEQGYRLLHLEVFANNDKAQGFYRNLGFEAETLHMIKPL